MRKRKSRQTLVFTGFAAQLRLFELGVFIIVINYFCLSFMQIHTHFYINYIIYYGLLIFCCQNVATHLLQQISENWQPIFEMLHSKNCFLLSHSHYMVLAPCIQNINKENINALFSATLINKFLFFSLTSKFFRVCEQTIYLTINSQLIRIPAYSAMLGSSHLSTK